MTNTRKSMLATALLTLALAATVAMAQAAAPAKGKAATDKPTANATPGVCDGAGPHGPRGMGMGMGAGMGGGKAGCGQACGMHGARGGKGMGGGRGMMGRGPGMGAGHGAGMGMLAGLDLTDAQQEKVAAIHERAARQNVQARADLQIAQMDLGKLMHADKPDPRAIDAQIDKLATLRASMQKAHTATMLEVHGLLTPEQLKKVKSMRGPGGHPGMGPGMGRGHGMGMGMGFDTDDDGPEDDGIEG